LFEPVPDDVGTVIIALVELTAAVVADAGDLRRVVALVVELSTVAADPAAAEPGDEFVIGDADERRAVDAGALGRQRFIERLRLDDVPGEAIEHGALLRIVAADALEQHLDGDFIGDEVA